MLLRPVWWQLTVWKYETFENYVRTAVAGCARGQHLMHATPTSSPDAFYFLLGQLLCGKPMRASPTGLARVRAANLCPHLQRGRSLCPYLQRS